MPRDPDFTLPAPKPATLCQFTVRAFPDMKPVARRLYDGMIGQGQFAVKDPVADMDNLSRSNIVNAVAGAEQADAVQRV